MILLKMFLWVNFYIIIFFITKNNYIQNSLILSKFYETEIKKININSFLTNMGILNKIIKYIIFL